MSVFAPYMQKFVDAKEALGFSRKYFESVLGLLDRFFIEEKVRTPFITSVLIDKWGHTLINNSYKTICSKYSILAQFAKYMNNIGFPCYVPRIPKSKANTYAPYIFTHDKVLSILQCVFSCGQRSRKYGQPSFFYTCHFSPAVWYRDACE